MFASVLLVAALSGAAPGATVRVDNIAFAPRKLQVQRGTAVTWRFQERYVTHNVHSVGKQRFKSSRDLKVGARYTVKFRKRGTYRYVCTLHPGMDGKVVVGS